MHLLHRQEKTDDDAAIEIIKEDPNNPNTYKIICADTNDKMVESNYEIQTGGNSVLEIYDFHDDDDNDDGGGLTERKFEPTTNAAILTDNELRESIAQLLKTVVEEDVLKKFGYPKMPIEKVLSSVIKQCGQSPVDSSTCPDESTKLRENVKLLFISVIDDESIREMLNNHTIDEVINHVLKLSETN